VELARAGHERAFATTVERYRRPLHAFAGRLGADGRAEDIVQQTFLQAFASLRSGTEVRHLRGWLHQIVRNAAIPASEYRNHSSEVELLETATESAQQAAEMRMLTVDALAEIARLPTRQHEALVAMAIQGRSRGEVAERMGLSEGAVRQLVHRARETLRSAVTAITPFPLVRALTAACLPSDRLPELAVGAGSASAAGIAAKLGTLAASGVLATGILLPASRPAWHPVGAANGRASVVGSDGSVVHSLRAAAPPLIVSSGTAVQGRSEASGRGQGRSTGTSGDDRANGTPGGSGEGARSGDGGPGPSSSDGAGTRSGTDGGPTASTASGGSSADRTLAGALTSGSSGNDGGTSGGGPAPSGGGGSGTPTSQPSGGSSGPP
jgi:RNA polymerase sigma factor (sigma-70 family)